MQLDFRWERAQLLNFRKDQILLVNIQTHLPPNNVNHFLLRDRTKNLTIRANLLLDHKLANGGQRSDCLACCRHSFFSCLLLCFLLLPDGLQFCWCGNISLTSRVQEIPVITRCHFNNVTLLAQPLDTPVQDNLGLGFDGMWDVASGSLGLHWRGHKMLRCLRTAVHHTQRSSYYSEEKSSGQQTVCQSSGGSLLGVHLAVIIHC
mmetsp:Transcript_74549/g.125705  ORF Transcript_74549/g.125705 Transcript_74549/m.125705 type:complete len:205 (+) Transcript_74549:930-1544(+)